MDVGWRSDKGPDGDAIRRFEDRPTAVSRLIDPHTHSRLWVQKERPACGGTPGVAGHSAVADALDQTVFVLPGTAMA